MLDILMWIGKDIQPGRLFESLIIMVGVLWKLGPAVVALKQKAAEAVAAAQAAVKSLDSVKTELQSLKETVAVGFQNGEQRFDNLENRVKVLEHQPQGEVND